MNTKAFEDLTVLVVDVNINWLFDEEDDTMEELGEEFAEDLEHAKFNMKKMES